MNILPKSTNCPSQYLLTFSLSILISVFGSSTALAETFVVNSTIDSGPGSFRAAISLANATPEEDTIVFDRTVFSSPKTITLTTGEVIITAPVEIDGPGIDQLTISGNSQSRVLFLRNTASVRLSNLTIGNGRAPSFTQNGFGGYAGGIYIDGGSLVLSRVTVDNCIAEQSAGIYNGQGQLRIVESTISNNQAIDGRNDGSYGGGIFNDGDLIIESSKIVGNIARGGNEPTGGGLTGSAA